MKTKLTKNLESTLYQYCKEQGSYVVEEVSMPDDKGIVDTLSYQQLRNDQIEWRCYELKVTKSDFHSKAKLSFIGNYNYFVLPQKLFEEVADEIPSHIGVLIYRAFDKKAMEASPQTLVAPGFLTIAKKAQFQELQVDEKQLTSHFVASLFREVDKAKKVEKGLQLYSEDRLFKELKKRQKAGYDVYNPDNNLYDRFIEETQNDAITALQDELDARNAEYQELKLQLQRLQQPNLEDKI
ncbi:hypothetical protein FD33_GL000333 [Companilactobacillus paralimentarius DSM 13238 = JCM 10415]|jgi:hypothetical protein|uniref:Uncharacterized protein n=1 Tax=Companilactobacillus paralimentarius DSM 13238 = JCM 10415 TaxID=1122151 RepID=A0A0R1PSL6_9LACO|nr:hypothetical protein [Companilactobacillus paralimentarius]KAE9565257.1 hypothetical protein ATN96_04370 [Companilactobacillus paralimentarius]KRL32522.1 hypothetical protein FD33_GL000333 [Companilactobacillus paralimentarius DSM 13238 = JCM 10415]MDR4933078.1 hypothetical protein [Companilactobacillus paralimentarius]QFR69606.1 hypothetical protein LP238_07245 [Companilactobacillus paralimentarius]